MGARPALVRMDQSIKDYIQARKAAVPGLQHQLPRSIPDPQASGESLGMIEKSSEKVANFFICKLELVQVEEEDAHTSYLSFFLHKQNFWRIKFAPKKRVNYDKIHSKLPIFCVITAKYTVNCQFFALNL